MNHRRVVVVSRHWHERTAELSFAIRSIAGAATRGGPVSVLVPGTPGRCEPDGAFELVGIGAGEALEWPDELSSECTVVVDEVTAELATMLTRARPTALLYLSASGGGLDPTWRKLCLVGDDPSCSVNVHVPVNPLARLHRHHGFGFTGYQLVLSDGSGSREEPPPAAAWLSSAFSDAEIVVIEEAAASAWKGRSLRGSVTVDTRMDLWRLMAHANVCVDLAPGPHVARECVEALRFGTPIVVPADSGPAAVHRASGRRDVLRRARPARGGWRVPERGQPVGCLGCRSVLCRCPLRRCRSARLTHEGAAGRSLIRFSRCGFRLPPSKCARRPRRGGGAQDLAEQPRCARCADARLRHHDPPCVQGAQI